VGPSNHILEAAWNISSMLRDNIVLGHKGFEHLQQKVLIDLRAGSHEKGRDYIYINIYIHNTCISYTNTILTWTPRPQIWKLSLGYAHRKVLKFKVFPLKLPPAMGLKW
jgi:hypothetical protein